MGWLTDRARRRYCERAQRLVDGKVIAAAFYGWKHSSWPHELPGRLQPELAPGFPPLVMIALTEEEMWFLAPVKGITNLPKHGAIESVLGHWPRDQVEVLFQFARVFGKPVTVTLPVAKFAFPDREPAILYGDRGADRWFNSQLGPLVGTDLGMAD